MSQQLPAILYSFIANFIRVYDTNKIPMIVEVKQNILLNKHKQVTKNSICKFLNTKNAKINNVYIPNKFNEKHMIISKQDEKLDQVSYIYEVRGTFLFRSMYVFIK